MEIRLPSEIWMTIINLLSIQDIAKFRRICKYTKSLIRGNVEELISDITEDSIFCSLNQLMTFLGYESLEDFEVNRRLRKIYDVIIKDTVNNVISVSSYNLVTCYMVQKTEGSRIDIITTFLYSLHLMILNNPKNLISISSIGSPDIDEGEIFRYDEDGYMYIDTSSTGLANYITVPSEHSIIKNLSGNQYLKIREIDFYNLIAFWKLFSLAASCSASLINSVKKVKARSDCEDYNNLNTIVVCDEPLYYYQHMLGKVKRIIYKILNPSCFKYEEHYKHLYIACKSINEILIRTTDRYGLRDVEQLSLMVKTKYPNVKVWASALVDGNNIRDVLL